MTNDSRQSEVDELFRVYREIASSSAYGAYASYMNTFDMRMVEVAPSLLDQLAPAISAREEAQRGVSLHEDDRSLPARLRAYLAIEFAAIAFLVLAAGAYIQHGFNTAPAIYPMFAWPFVLGAILLTAIVSWATGVILQERGSAIRSARVVLGRRNGEFEQRRAALVEAAFTKIVNETLGPEGKLPFPSRAPRLVELDTSDIVPSASAEFLRDFIGGHAASAVGIAGPRGCGKSTLMRGLASDPDLFPLHVWMTAPVRYDSTDFIRRLYLNVAETILGKTFYYEKGYMQVLRARHTLRVRRNVVLTAIALGSILLLADILPDHLLPALPLSGLGVTGIAIMVGGLLTGVFSRRIWQIRRYSYLRERGLVRHSSTPLAELAVKRLSYDVETSSKNKNAAKLFGGLFTLEDEDSETLKDHALTQADLVNDLRELLAVFAREHEKPILILIDELDKISLTSVLHQGRQRT